MEQATAVALRDNLIAMEGARQALEEASDEDAAGRATEYQRVREAAGPAFLAAQSEYELANAASPAATDDPATQEARAAEAPRPREAAPGVPLVTSPGMVVTPANIADFGMLAWYIPRDADAATVNPVQATAYAFDAGTAVQSLEGEVATAQPSRIIVGTDGLGVVTQDQFGQSYTDCPPDLAPNPMAQPAQTAPETPVEGAGEAEPPVGGETLAHDPAAPETPAGGSAPEAQA